MKRQFILEHKGIFYHIGSTFLMAMSPVLFKLGLESTEPLYAASLSCLFTSLFSCFGSNPKKWLGQHFYEKNLILVGGLNAIAIGFLFGALAIATPDIVAFINRFYIVFVVLWGILILKEKIRFIELVFLTLAITGLLMFSYRQLDWGFYSGIFLSFLSAIFFSVSNFYTKKILSFIDHNRVIFITNLFSGFFLMLSLFIFSRDFIPPSLRELMFIILGAFSGGYLGLNLFYKGLNECDFHVAGIIRSFVPLLTMAYSIQIFGLSALTFFNGVGAFLLFFSLLAFFCSKLIYDYDKKRVNELKI